MRIAKDGVTRLVEYTKGDCLTIRVVKGEHEGSIHPVAGYTADRFEVWDRKTIMENIMWIPREDCIVIEQSGFEFE